MTTAHSTQVPVMDTKELSRCPGKAALTKKCQVRRPCQDHRDEGNPGVFCAVDWEGAAAGGGASSLPVVAVVDLLPGEICWEQAGLLPPAEKRSCCWAVPALHNPSPPSPGGGVAGQGQCLGSCSHPQLAGGHQCSPDAAPPLPELPRGPGNRPGRSDTAADGGERVWRGAGSAPRRRQKREVPKPSAVENNQVARWEAAGG